LQNLVFSPRKRRAVSVDFIDSAPIADDVRRRICFDNAAGLLGL
jgi:predicted TIM-barrel fold metal-dependent hydrolase